MVRSPLRGASGQDWSLGTAKSDRLLRAYVHHDKSAAPRETASSAAVIIDVAGGDARWGSLLALAAQLLLGARHQVVGGAFHGEPLIE